VPHPNTADLEALLRELAAAGIEYIVVGGAAAVIHGAPITTQDLDIVPRQRPEDIERLLQVLERLGARFRPVRPGRDLPPTLEHLSGHGQLNLTTCHGPLDILLRLHDARGYAELLPHSREVSDQDLRMRVLDLDTLIEIKRATGRAKDALVVPILLALRGQNT
jgi:hypothetical protein